MKRFHHTFFVYLYLITPSVFAAGYADISDSVRLYYELSGKGEPLLLIPGGPGDDHRYFKPYFKKLEKNFTVIYFDARGRGLSKYTGNDSSFSVESDVGDIHRLCEVLGFASIHVFGHSYGGIVAQQLAVKHPERVNKLILCNTFHSAQGWQNNIDNCNRHIRENYPDQWIRLMELRKTVKSDDEGWRGVYDPCINNLYWFDISKRKEFVGKVSEYEVPSAVVFSYRVYYAIVGNDPDYDVNGTMKDMDLRPVLSNIQSPVLVITGRGDRIATVKQALEIHQLISKSRLHIFQISGHLPFVEEPDSFIEIMLDFLKGNK
jgi:proline iminopeptidase